MDQDQAGEFLAGIEQGVYQQQTNRAMGAELANRLSDPYMARLDAFWNHLVSDYSPGLNKAVRPFDIYGQLCMAFTNWLEDTGTILTAGEHLALISRMDELEEYFKGKLAEWDAEHP